jgi:hypothetical protein
VDGEEGLHPLFYASSLPSWGGGAVARVTEWCRSDCLFGGVYTSAPRRPLAD